MSLLKVICMVCNSPRVSKAGDRRYTCNDCGSSFTE